MFESTNGAGDLQQRAGGRPAIAVAIAAVCLAVRLVLLAFAGPVTMPDSQRYLRIARNLCSGNGYSSAGAAPYEPELMRPPGYPAFLAVFGGSRFAAASAQCLLDTISCLLIWRIGSVLLGRTVGLWAGGLYAVYPFAAYFSVSILTETFATFLLLLRVWAWVRFEWLQSRPERPLTGSGLVNLLLCGTAMGALTLVRPSFLALPLLVGYVIWRQGIRCPGRMMAAVVVLISAGAVVLPWTVRNFLIFRRFVPVATGFGQSLWMGSLEFDEGFFSPPPEAINADPAYRAYLHRSAGRDSLRYDMLLRDRGLRRIASRPGRYLLSCLFRMIRVWMPLMYEARLPRPVKAVTATGSLLLVLLAVSAVVLLRRQWLRLLPLWLPMVYISFFFCPLHVEARYSMPARGLAIILAVAAIERLWAFFSGFRRVPC